MKTTHIGSLPHLNIEQALEYSFRFDVPAIPTLPKLDKNQFMGADIFHLLKLGSVEKQKYRLNKDYTQTKESLTPFYWDEFFKKFQHSDKKEFKYQSMGPISFYTMVKKSHDVEFKDIYELLHVKYSELLTKLKEKGDFLFVLDEPLLFQDFKNTYPALESFCDELMKIHSNVVIHCCGKLKPFQVNQSQLALNLDLKLYSKEELNSIKTRVIPGITLTKDDEKPRSLEVLSLDKFKPEYLTPACGMVYKTLDELEVILENLNAIKNLNHPS